MDEKVLQTVLETLTRLELKIDGVVRREEQQQGVLDLLYNDRNILEDTLTTARSTRDTLNYHRDHQAQVQKNLSTDIHDVGERLDALPQEVKDVVAEQVGEITESIAGGQVLIKQGLFGKIKMLLVKKPKGVNGKGA